MGVIDRLRGLATLGSIPGTELAPSAEGAPEPERDFAPAIIGEQRGDFMMLPPLTQTFGSLARIQQPIGTFLVTHRPTAVTNEPLSHGIEDGPLGLITARAHRRSSRPSSRRQRDALVHRARGEDEPEDISDERSDSGLPPLPPPRRLAASTRAASAPSPEEPARGSAPLTNAPANPARATPLLPSRSEVGRAVRAPSLPAAPGRGASAPDVLIGNVIEPWSPAPFTAPEMPASTISGAPDSVPVLRRRASRGRINTPVEVEDPEDALVEQALAEMAVDATEPNDAGGIDAQAAGSVWAGPTPLANSRVRGAAPPVPASSPQPHDLRHRRTGESGAALPADAIAAPPPSPTPPAEAAGSPIAPGPVGSTRATPITPQAGSEGMTNAAALEADPRGSASTPFAEPAAVAGTSGTPAVVPAGRSTGSRATLASRPPLVSGGTTGVQRRARDDSGGMSTATPTGLRATMPRAGQPPAGAGSAGSPGGSRSVSVPEQVRQAVRESVGTAPSEVVVHEGGRAEALTRSVNAEAFTRDGEIFLASDAPLDSPRGQQLLAHELTHVVQQKGGAQRMPAEHTAEGLDLEAGARHAEGLMKSMHQAPPQLHHRSNSVSAPAVPQMMAGEGVQRSPRSAPLPAGSPEPIPSAPALSRGGPQPVNFLDDNWRIELGQRPEGVATSSMSDSELALSSAPPPTTKDEKSGRLRDLERQAHELYPLIRQRLRAELVRDKERRGRMSREWG